MAGSVEGEGRKRLREERRRTVYTGWKGEGRGRGRERTIRANGVNIILPTTTTPPRPWDFKGPPRSIHWSESRRLSSEWILKARVMDGQTQTDRTDGEEFLSHERGTRNEMKEKEFTA